MEEHRCCDSRPLESNVEDSRTQRTVLLKNNPIYKSSLLRKKKQAVNKFEHCLFFN